jgi:hypothetical protein
MISTMHIAAIRRNAVECERRLSLAVDPASKTEWADLIIQWHWLANQANELLSPATEELEFVANDFNIAALHSGY